MTGSKLTCMLSPKTSTMQHLHMDSCHLKHSKTAIPYSYMLFLWTICSSEENLLKGSLNLKQHFLMRGYCKHVLNHDIQKVLNTPRGVCLPFTWNQDKSAPTSLAVTYHPISSYSILNYDTWLRYIHHPVSILLYCLNCVHINDIPYDVF